MTETYRIGCFTRKEGLKFSYFVSEELDKMEALERCHSLHNRCASPQRDFRVVKLVDGEKREILINEKKTINFPKISEETT